jgi:hypothetical protein
MCSPEATNSNKRGYIAGLYFGNAGAASETAKNDFRLAARGQDGGEGTNVKDELPALLLREAFFEGGHGFSALADLVKNLTVCDAVHVLGIDQARGRGIVAGGVRSIAFSGLAVALDTFIQIEGAASGQGRRGRLDGIAPALGFFGNFPGPIFIISQDGDNAEGNEYQGEKKFPCANRVL